MNRKKLFITGLSVLSGLMLGRSLYETGHIKAVNYKIRSEKIPADTKIKIAFLSDLHCRSYGYRNIELLRLVSSLGPDLIFSGGDMITASRGSAESDREVLSFVRALKKIAPVYYAMGNHEEYLKTETDRFGKRFADIKAFLEKAGIPLLENSRIDLDNNISLYGLEISRRYYRRLCLKKPKPSHMEKYLGIPDESRYNILLAHMPGFFDVYETWKPDLVLSGHYHGGIIGIPSFKEKEQRRGLISPGLKLLPDYCAGKFRKNDTDMIVSAGCGSHSINIRLFNMPEVVCVELSSEA